MGQSLKTSVSNAMLVLATICVFFFGSTVHAQISEYGYPDFTSDLSTICSPGIHVPKSKYESLDVRVLKSDKKFRRPKMKLRFYPATLDQKGKHHQELVVILTGLLSEPNSVYAKFYAQVAQAKGFNVLVFPNTMTPNFVRSASSIGLVGDTSRDSVDLHRAIQASLVTLKKEKGIVPPSIKMIGFSHGALLSAAVDQVNESVGGLSIHSVLMVNTPVSLLYGLRNLDARAKAGSKIDFPRLVKIALRFRSAVKAVTAEPTTIDTFRKFSTALRLTPEEQYGLIGIVMTRGFGNTILATQEVNDFGIFPELSPHGSVVRKEDERARAVQANGYSYEEYITTFFGEEARRKGENLDIVALEARASLPAYESHLRKAFRITLIHNLDDILLRKGDVEWLKSVFGPRANIYPRGGHMGNIWYQDNARAYETWLLN